MSITLKGRREIKLLFPRYLQSVQLQGFENLRNDFSH